MAPRPPDPDSKPRRLIVNADDFGRSASINQAVIRAHREGILTTASLMVNEAAGEEAVALAREHPNLGVGLHLTLLCGHSALPGERIPGLVNASGEFTNNPAGAGFRYFFQRSLNGRCCLELTSTSGDKICQQVVEDFVWEINNSRCPLRFPTS